jgi:hypothetical protein
MPQCSLGSQPKSATPDFIWLTWAKFLAFLAARFTRLGPAVSIWFPDNLVSAETFCATEPVVPDPPTLLEWAQLLNPITAASSPAAAYLIATFKSWLWEQQCECIAPPSGVCSNIAIPWDTLTDLGVPAENRVTVLRGTALQAGVVVYGADVYVHDTPTIGRLLLWNQATTAIIRSKNITPGAGKHRVLFDTPYTMANGEFVWWAWEADPSNHYYSWGTNGTPPSDGVLSYSSYLENSDYSVSFSWGSRTYKGPLMPLACVGGPPAGSEEPDTYTPTDPVDPVEIPTPDTVSLCDSFEDVCAQINLLRLQLDTLGRAVVVNVPPTAPTSFTLGSPLNSLTGSGSVSVSGIVGVLVQCDVPLRWGRSVETPPRYMPRIAMVQFSTADVVGDAHFVHYDEQYVFGAEPTTDEVVFNFPLGVTGSITPLLRTLAVPAPTV